MEQQESIFFFVIAFPEIYRAKHGDYWSCQVVLVLILFLLTATCQICIVQVAGDYIMHEKYSEFSSSLAYPLPWDLFRIVRGSPFEIPPFLPWPHTDLGGVADSLDGTNVSKVRADNNITSVFKNEYGNEEKCCHDYSCAHLRPCCLPSRSDRRGTAKMDQIVIPSRLSAICHSDISGDLECAQPSYQMVDKFGMLDLNEDGMWARDEAEEDHLNMGCQTQLSMKEVFRIVCLGIMEDALVRRNLGVEGTEVPFEISSMVAVPQKYFQAWEGLVVICAVMDVARCGELIASGLFDGILGLPLKSLGGIHQEEFLLHHALDYCYSLLNPGGVCDKTLPVTFAMHRQKVTSKCGVGSYDTGPLVTNPTSKRDTIRTMTVSYSTLGSYEMVHSWVFRFFLWINLILWFVTLNKELEGVLELVDFCINFPQSETSGLRIKRENLNVQHIRETASMTVQRLSGSAPRQAAGDSWAQFLADNDGCVKITSMDMAHRLMCIFMFMIRAINLFFMGSVGIIYASFTHSYLDILMNTVALAFVFELPELFYHWLVPAYIKDLLDCCTILPYVSAFKVMRSWCPTCGRAMKSKYVQGLVVIPIIALVIVQTTDYHVTRPMLDVLRCACLQEGGRCEVARKLTKDWWDVHWAAVKEIM